MSPPKITLYDLGFSHPLSPHLNNFSEASLNLKFCEGTHRNCVISILTFFLTELVLAIETEKLLITGSVNSASWL